MVAYLCPSVAAVSLWISGREAVGWCCCCRGLNPAVPAAAKGALVVGGGEQLRSSRPNARADINSNPTASSTLSTAPIPTCSSATHHFSLYGPASHCSLKSEYEVKQKNGTRGVHQRDKHGSPKTWNDTLWDVDSRGEYDRLGSMRVYIQAKKRKAGCQSCNQQFQARGSLHMNRPKHLRCQ